MDDLREQGEERANHPWRPLVIGLFFLAVFFFLFRE